ncbi:DUF397 domain-containing protein [Saccharopolyspora hattusasensis]|uniref:DUF397 domain-containing protein n=1 Tax=Saccharopolyspora hattusasensis TaxID=1128679 RepID=UPI003D9A06F2
MPTPKFASAHWRKSTYSNETGACIEVASVPDLTGIRDSKQHGSGPILAFDRELWSAFISKLKTGRFDRP